MKLMGLFLLLSLSLQAAASGVAAQFSEDFLTRNQMSTASALWNHATGFVTPTMLVKGWDDGAVHDTAIDFGDGSLGDFNSSTWAQFAVSVNTGTKIIVLDTDAHPVFYFRNFTLDLGWKIDPIGSNPLVIYVLGDMTVNGVIDCSGHSGSSSTGSGVSAVLGTGGAGRCGGARGGDGGPVYPGAGSSSGQAGSVPALAPLITGGNPGTITAAGTGSGGGGGGAWGNTASSAAAGVAGSFGTGGAAGTQSNNRNWTQFFGAAGGGGGSGSTLEAGGGGGGGGGILILHVGRSLIVGTNGLILANGGDGGSSPSAGGGGGAGGGGSVQVWVGKDITLLGSVPNTISGKSGAVGAPATGGAGGLGGEGRTWIVTPVGGFDNSASGFVASNDPSSLLNSEGNTESSISSQSVVSKAFDTSSTLAQFTSASFSPASVNVSLEVAGSSDQFQTDDSGWVQASNISQLNNKRYLRFRLTLNNLSGTAPETVDSVTLNYTANERKEFEMKSSGCGVIQSPQPPGPAAGLIFLPLLLLVLLQCSNPKVRPAPQPVEKLR